MALHDDAAPAPTPSRPRGVSADTLWVFAGNFILGVGLWGVLAVLARAGSRAMVGEYAFALAVASPATQWANMQLRTIIATATDGRFGARPLWRLSGWVNGAAVLITGTAAALADWHPWWLIAGSCLAKAIDNFSDAIDGQMQRRLEFRVAASSKLARSMVLVLGTWWILHLGFGVVGVAGVLVLASVVGWLVNAGWAYLWSGKDQALPSASVAPSRDLAGRGLSLGAVLFLISIQQNIPRYIIEGALGAEALGLFAAANYFTVAGGLFVQAACQATLPRLAATLSRSDFAHAARQIMSLVGVVFTVGVFGVWGAWTFGEVLLGVLYGPTFAEGADIFVGLMAVATLNFVGAVLRHVLTTLGRVRGQTLSVLLGAILASVGCSLGVGWAGLQGVVVALLGVAMLYVLVLALVFSSAWRRRKDAARGVPM